MREPLYTLSRRLLWKPQLLQNRLEARLASQRIEIRIDLQFLQVRIAMAHRCFKPVQGTRWFAPLRIDHCVENCARVTAIGLKLGEERFCLWLAVELVVYHCKTGQPIALIPAFTRQARALEVTACIVGVAEPGIDARVVRSKRRLASIRAIKASSYRCAYISEMPSER